jgi:hypothetical protein
MYKPAFCKHVVCVSGMDVFHFADTLLQIYVNSWENQGIFFEELSKKIDVFFGIAVW